MAVLFASFYSIVAVWSAPVDGIRRFFSLFNLVFHQVKKQCLTHEHNRIYNKHQFMFRMTAVSAYAFSCLMNKLFIHVTLSWVWWRWSKRSTFYFTWAIDKMCVCNCMRRQFEACMLMLTEMNQTMCSFTAFLCVCVCLYFYRQYAFFPLIKIK